MVTKDIPDFEVWGGNPARFIKAINDTDSTMGEAKLYIQIYQLLIKASPFMRS